ncbi:hypothetical protein MF271_24180 (plasmid) [Deinococcus sp. KNUC1210]|uniref:TolB family protein n=1 Tax=Deinococcus sp. KNUC1210 TaxID=2917691 RepID=UPI001EF0B1F5|nr:hypothetical protein [Deinococcus sp. KNUC1210]ULH18061.1 hypothetical protein MF271_24180 [Deinococcus sp. KNUC1210]
MDVRPNWTPDSSAVVFERLLAGTRSLYQVLANGTGLTELTLCNLSGTNATGRPAFFDLNDFAFVSDRSGRPALWRCNLPDGTITLLVESSQACHGPSVATTDLQMLLYFQQMKEQTFHVYQRDADGNTRQLTNAPGVQDQPWQLPDARSFVYHAQEDEKNLIYLQPTALGAQRVCLSPEDEGTAYVTPFPSPDGQWVAFSCTHSGTSQVWVMRVDGTNRQQVTTGEPHSFPAWSPDGCSLVVVRGEPVSEQPSGHLWVFPLQASG